ncbi:unnamed protein product [Ostreobium quekettii]|uniref:ASCH domain-containing protein n=1 Tax=Ostreobium quekettii TaxID=121088 RepID=A0A8S1IYN2_9CHLO|nr:unnamed protein product [Ostreobium quekettii]|eukprot:evm.model.scf_1892.3 EVM.evm.TU.scf_1892.3   scf_1892:16301-17858(-)
MEAVTRTVFAIANSCPASSSMPPKDEGKCISMHQPWASLLVHGVKRIEGRSWPTDLRGRLWVHATAKAPDPQHVREVEALYRTIYEMEGKTVRFPESYPSGVLLGCVEVVDCLQGTDVEGWEGLPDSIKLEVGSPYCFLCEQPQRLLVLHPVRGWPGIWKLPKKIVDTAGVGLARPTCVEGEHSWKRFGRPKVSLQGQRPTSGRENMWKEKYGNALNRGGVGQ